MNVSKINSNSLNFGVVKRRAQERAIGLANGDTSKLREVINLIDSQKTNNKYDVDFMSSGKYFGYVVTQRIGYDNKHYFVNFYNACQYAEERKKLDIWSEKASKITQPVILDDYDE